MMAEKSRNSEIKTLEELSLEGCPVLVDTSVIMSPLGRNRGDYTSTKGKFYFTGKNREFLIKVRKYIENGSKFYITELIRQEIRGGRSYPYRKIIREEGGCKYRKLLDLRRLIVKEEKDKGRLAESFRDNNRIIILNKEEEKFYKELSNKYERTRKRYSLSSTDFDLLLKGVVLALMSNPISLLSNDYSIFYLRNKLLNENYYLIERDIRFFKRKGFFDFESLVMKNSSQKFRNSAVIPK